MTKLTDLLPEAIGNVKKGRRFIPPTIEFPKDLRRGQFNEYFKLLKKKNDGDTVETFSISDKGKDILRQAKAGDTLPKGITIDELKALISTFKAGDIQKADYADAASIAPLSVSKIFDNLVTKGLVNKQGGGAEYKLYINPLMKSALEQIERGRPSADYRLVTPELIKQITDKIPSNLRSLLKKYSPKINPSVGMYPVNVKIKEVTPNGDITFYNPGSAGDAALDTVISERNDVDTVTIGELEFEKNIQTNDSLPNPNSDSLTTIQNNKDLEQWKNNKDYSLEVIIDRSQPWFGRFKIPAYEENRKKYADTKAYFLNKWNKYD
jgi:predicted transcriptional regulator